MLHDRLEQLNEDWLAVPLPIRQAVADGTILVALGAIGTAINMHAAKYAWDTAPAELFLVVAVCNVIWAGEKWAAQRDSDAGSV